MLTKTCQDYVNEHFLTTLFRVLGGTQSYVLRVVRPEGSEDFDLRKSIVTFAPEMNEVVLHCGTHTTQVFLRDNWVEMQCANPEYFPRVISYIKSDVMYQFVRI